MAIPLRDWWLKERYRMKKKVEIEPGIFENLKTNSIETMKPLVIVEGEESFSGAQPVEISFEDIGGLRDIEIDHDGVEIESFDLEDNKIIAWVYDEFTPDTSFYIYYGRKNDWATKLDDLLRKTKKNSQTETFEVTHLK